MKHHVDEQPVAHDEQEDCHLLRSLPIPGQADPVADEDVHRRQHYHGDNEEWTEKLSEEFAVENFDKRLDEHVGNVALTEMLIEHERFDAVDGVVDVGFG